MSLCTMFFGVVLRQHKGWDRGEVGGASEGADSMAVPGLSFKITLVGPLLSSCLVRHPFPAGKLFSKSGQTIAC